MHHNLKLRVANKDDTLMYFEWVNDADVRLQSFNSDPVLWKNHQEWYEQKLLDQNCLMLVLEENHTPIGQIRFDIHDGVAYIDYSIDKKNRGRNFGEILVREGMKFVSNINRSVIFHADVKRQNIASTKIFNKLGFNEQEVDDPDVRQFVFYLRG